MEIINSNNYMFNGLNTSPKSLTNDFSPISNNENKSLDVNLNNFEENNQNDLPIPYFEHKLRNIKQNIIGSLSDKATERILNNNNELNKQKINNFDEILENGLNLEEQNLKDYYSKIENELTKLKNEKKEDINDNSNIKNNNIINNKLYLNSNSQFEGDLFYYSEEDEIKKIQEIKDNNNIIKNNLNKEQLNINNKNINNKKKIDKINKDNKNIIIEEEKNDKNISNNLFSDIQIDKDLYKTIEYGIDENGNPFYVKNNDEEIKNNERNKQSDNLNNNKINENKKAVAFIIQQKENGKNYLIDRKGKKIQKTEEGDFYYKNDNIRILIKDFDVQHPELRVYGARKKDTLVLNEENEEKEESNNHKSIEINYSNNIKEKILERNTILNNSKRKNILSNNFNDENFIKFNKNLFNFRFNSPIVLNKNLKNNKLINKENQSNIWKDKENQKTYGEGKFTFNKNRKELFYKKINPNLLKENIIINSYRKIDNLDAIRRTNNILNKSVTGLNTNRNYISNSRIDSSLNNIDINKSEYNKKLEINNSLYNNNSKENNNYTQEIKNITCTSSRINLYKYKRLKKRGGSTGDNYCKIFNLKSLIKGKIENKNDKNLTNKNKENNNIDIKDNKDDNKSKIIKSKSCKYYISTIDKISNNIKYIKNKIEKNLMKLNIKDDISKSSNNENIKNTIPMSTISTCNSQDNTSKDLLTYSNYNYYNENSRNINNLNDKINIDKFKNLQLNKKINIKTPSKKQFQCAILSKEVNDIISNYTNRIHQKEKTNENINKKIELYDYKNEIKNNEKKINSFLNGKKNKISSNYVYNLTQRYNNITEPDNSTFKENISEISKNKNNESCELCGQRLLYKLNDKNNNIIDKKQIKYNPNNNQNFQILHSQNNSRLNENQQNLNFNNNQFTLFNTFTEPKVKFKNSSNKIKINNKANSVSSLNEIYDDSTNYSRKTFNNNCKYKKNSFISNNSINNYNKTEINNFNSNKFI